MSKWPLTSLVLALFSPGFARAEPVGAVTATRGETALERGDDRRAAQAGADVLLDDRATTGAESRLDLRLGAATRLRLGANSSLKIDKFVAKLSAETTLDRGAVLVDRGEGAEKTFELDTPYGLLSARGTVFFAGPSQGTFGVFVEKGAIDVVAAHRSLHLVAGEGVDFPLLDAAAPPPPTGAFGSVMESSPAPAPSPVRKWDAARVQEALSSVR